MRAWGFGCGFLRAGLAGVVRGATNAPANQTHVIHRHARLAALTRTAVLACWFACSLFLPAAHAQDGCAVFDIVSVSSDGTPGNGTHLRDLPSRAFRGMSADGNLVVFASDATDLAPDNTEPGFYLRDRAAGTTEALWTRVDGAVVRVQGDAPAMSADGRFITFASARDDLVLEDTNGLQDIFVYDRSRDTTERVSVNSTGVQADGDCFSPTISADGRFVAFQSNATTLVSDGLSGGSFILDRLTGTLERVGSATASTQSNESVWGPVVSGDGRFVAFWGFGDDLVPDDTNEATDVFVLNRLTGVTERVSVSTAGEEGNENSVVADISADGRFVAFLSMSTNLDDLDISGIVFPNIALFVRDRTLGTTRRASVSSTGDAAAEVDVASMSADGRFVIFSSSANNLVEPDTNGLADDVFLHDLQSGETRMLTVNDTGQQGNTMPIDLAGLSRDGRVVVFEASTSAVPLLEGYSGHQLYVADNCLVDTGPAACSLQLITPADGMTWIEGWPATIIWSGAPENPTDPVRLELLYEGAVLYVIAESTPNDGSHSLIVLNILFGPGHTVRISGAGSAGTCAVESAVPFSIEPRICTLGISSPNSREPWTIGQRAYVLMHRIFFGSGYGGIPPAIAPRVLLYRGEELVATIADAGPTYPWGYVEWIVPQDLEPGPGYFVVVENLAQGPDDILCIPATSETFSLNIAPVVHSLTATPDTVILGEPVQFEAVASDVDGTVEQYWWSFGEPGADPIAGGPVIEHTYTEPGVWPVRVLVEDNAGGMASSQWVEITVQFLAVLEARPPVAPVGMEVDVRWVNIPIPIGSSWSAWIWTDGERTFGLPGTTRAFAAPGTYGVSVEAYTHGTGDARGNTSVEIVPAIPTSLTLKAPPEVVLPGTSATFTVESDPPDSPLVQYTWYANFDWSGEYLDPITTTEPILSIPVPETIAFDGYTWAMTGTLTVIVVAEDAAGGLAGARGSVSLGYEPPTASAGPDEFNIECDGGGTAPVMLDGTASTDPNGVVDIVAYEWREGATLLGTGQIITVPLEVGAHTITLQVTDVQGLQSTDSVEKAVVDTTPPAVTAPADVSVTTGDPAGGAVVIGAAVAADVCGSATVTNNAPDVFPIGSTTVTWTGTDGAGNSATATQTVTVTLETTPATGITLSADPPGSATAGDAVTWTAQGEGGTGFYEYQFWRNGPDTSGYVVEQAYGGGDTWVWDTTGLAGDHRVVATVRTAGTAVAWDTFILVNYAVTAPGPPPPATGVTAEADPPASQEEGLTATFTAAGQGGNGNYEYQFWRNGPDTSGYIVEQAYGGGDTWVWDTTGRAGDHRVVATVRTAGTSSTYDAFVLLDYTVTPAGPLPPATGATLGAAPASPQPQGTIVTFTGGGVGGTGTYEFAFWRNAADTGGNWALQQNYSTDPTWDWNTAGLAGSHTIAVTVRTAGTSVNMDAFALAAYTVQP